MDTVRHKTTLSLRLNFHYNWNIWNKGDWNMEEIAFELRPFLNEQGQLISLPAKNKKKLLAIWYLAERIPARRRFRGSGKFSGGRRIAKRIQAAQRFRQRFPAGIRESFRQAVSLRRGRLQKTLRRRLWAAPQKVLGRARRRWRVLSANAAVAPRGLQSVRIFASGGVSVAYFSASGGVLPGLARRISQSATGFNRPRARFN